MVKRKTKTNIADGTVVVEKPKEQTAPANLDAVADDLLNASEQPSASFIEHRQQDVADQEAEHAGLRDKLGYTFDKAIHYFDSDGVPKVNKDGTLARRRIRKAKGAKQVASEASAVQLNADQQTQARYAGVAAAGCMFVVCTGLGGEDWVPRKDDVNNIDERKELERAFGDYFVSKGWTEFPPGIALTLAVGMYAAPRFTLPATQSRMKKNWGKVKAWSAKRKAKREPQSNRGHDEQREIDAGETVGDVSKATRASSDRTRPNA